MKKKISWNEAMIRNTEYLSWGRKTYGKRFEMPYEIDDLRATMGKKKRPKRFQV